MPRRADDDDGVDDDAKPGGADTDAPAALSAGGVAVAAVAVGRDADEALGSAETAAATPTGDTASPIPGAEPVNTNDVTSPAPRRSPYRAVVPGVVLGRYEVAEELGAGGMATVYRAHDRDLRRDVAIKVMFPHLVRKDEVVRRFQREARAAAGLEHAHILRVYDVGGGGEGGDPPYIVMELVRGPSLREVLERHGPMPAEVAACVGAVLCDALAVAHGAGVIHRDVKPGNVMIGPGGRLLLADFGVARIDDDDSLVTRTGALLGTPSFMAPEQALGGACDARSDLYSVGASMYQLTTGTLPFSGPTAKVVAQILRGELTPAQRRRPVIGPDVGRAIERLMAREPAGRPATAVAAAQLLRTIATEGGLGDVEDELAAYFADPRGCAAARAPIILERTLARARAARSGSLPLAIALVDRALALAPAGSDAQRTAEALAAELARGGRRRWAAIAAAAIVVGGAAVAGAAVVFGGGGPDGAVGLIDGGASDDGGPTSSSSEGPDSVDGEADAGAASELVVIDAGPALAMADAGPGPRRDGGPAQRLGADGGRPFVRGLDIIDASPQVITIDAAAPPPVLAIDAAADSAAPPATATLTLAMDAWCDVTIDGQPHGRADRKRPITVPAGDHDVICSQGAGMGEWRGSVTLAPGQRRVVTGSVLRPVTVTVEVPGDGVRIGGTTYRRGAKITLRPGRYRVDLLDGGGAWVSIPRVTACTLRDTPSLDCYQ